MNNNKFLFRFNSDDLKLAFHIYSVKSKKSMNAILNDLVEQFLSKEMSGS